MWCRKGWCCQDDSEAGFQHHTLFLPVAGDANLDYMFSCFTLSPTQISKQLRYQSRIEFRIKTWEKPMDAPGTYRLWPWDTYICTRCGSEGLSQRCQVDKSSSHFSPACKQMEVHETWDGAGRETLQATCDTGNIPTREEWVTEPDKRELTKVVIQLVWECWNWTSGATDLQIHRLIQRHSQPQDYITFTDASSSENNVVVGASVLASVEWHMMK